MDAYRAIELTVYSILRILPYLLLMLYIFKGHLRFPKWVTISSVVIITALRCLCSYLLYFNGERLSNSNPGFLLLVAFTFLFIKDHWGKSLFSMLMLNNVSTFAVTAAKYLESLIFGDYALQLHRWTNIITLIVVEAAVLIPLFFYIKHIYMKAIHQTTSKRTWRMLWLVPFTFYAVWFRNSFYATENHELLSLELIYVFFCLLVNGGGMLIYTLVMHLINERVANDRLREKESLLTLQKAQYENLQERIEEAKTARHDMRQHLHMISAYLTDEKYPEAQAYINNLRKSIPESGSLHLCEHYATNAILQYFQGLAKENNIIFSTQIELPPDINIPDEALTVLLGNLCENAVHACIKEPNAVITVRGKIDKDSVFFKITNTFSGRTKRTSDGLFLSTKHEGRGIGLRSVRNIVSNYNGILKINPNGGLFTVSVLLKIPHS